MTLNESLEAMQLDALLWYAKGRPEGEEPKTTYRNLRNVQTQIEVTGGEVSEEGKALIKSMEIER